MIQGVRSETRHSVRTRVLAYGGLLLCAVLVLFGPQLSELGLSALGCRVGYGLSGVACGGALGGPIRALTRWGQASPPVETLFLLVSQLWPLLLLWVAAVALSMRADLTRTTRTLERDTPAAAPEPSKARLSADEARAQWIAAREAEQANETQADKRALSEQLFAETRFVGIVALACWLLICGFFAFCLAFGLPLLGGLSAEHTLAAFGCNAPTAEAMDPLSKACGALESRLEPYLRPFVGALLSPVWLFTQLGDVLLFWLGGIFLLAVLPVLRLGLRRVLKTFPAMSLTLLVATTLAAAGTAGAWLNSASSSTGPSVGDGIPVPALAFLETVALLVGSGVVLLILCLCTIIALLVLARRSRRGDDAPSGKPN